MVVRGRDKVPEKGTSSSESEGLRDFKHFRKLQQRVKDKMRVGKDARRKVRVNTDVWVWPNIT